MNKNQILELIGNVYDLAANCKLQEAFFDNQKQELQALSQYFKTTERQTLFIAVIFAESYNHSADHNDLIRHFGCNPMKLLIFNDDFEELRKKGILIIRKKKSRNSFHSSNFDMSYIINEKVTEALLQNLPIPEFKEEPINNIIDLLEQFYILEEQIDDDLISREELLDAVENLLMENAHFPLIAHLKRFDLNTKELYLVLCLIWGSLYGDNSKGLESKMHEIHNKHATRIDEIQKMLNGTHKLIKCKLVEIVEAGFFTDLCIRLTDSACQMLRDNGIDLYRFKSRKENIIAPTEIVEKKLMFDEMEMSQIATLQNVLQEQKFQEMQDRLKLKGLPKCVTVLLHGAPGTGKTEIVKQLARATNRTIMKVEISQTKSMMFGESEKLIKRVFTDYKDYCKGCEITPILFFNEADAIIAKRKENTQSNVAQTENTIQNIILEELENFEGILMATTNLAKNLDTAFERRFLFKVLFQKPKTNVRSQIWKEKMPALQDRECEILAERFDFSGGQIDNIIRKTEIHEIVNGTTINLDTMIDFCKEESLVARRETIGFLKTKN